MSKHRTQARLHRRRRPSHSAGLSARGAAAVTSKWSTHGLPSTAGSVGVEPAATAAIGSRRTNKHHRSGETARARKWIDRFRAAGIAWDASPDSTCYRTITVPPAFPWRHDTIATAEDLGIFFGSLWVLC